MNQENLKINESILELDIQPKAGVIGVFSRLNYKPWYAIAEFVDNSTQSFFNNREALAAIGLSSVKIDIKYNSVENSLTIGDNAFGMDLNDFERAVKLDSKPENQSGRNEFGMGLKTAASWFGDIWSVTSTALNSSHKYYTEVNIPYLRDSDKNTVQIHTQNCSKNEHGTLIKISDLSKKMDGPKTKSKIKEVLQSMYRRDILSDGVEIFFNDEQLEFEEYEPLTFRDKTWKKTVDFNVRFAGKIYHVTGFVGILKDGGFARAGFALFRRNRVVIGGNEFNYKPLRIFGQLQSTIAHKLYGEFDLDTFPVNQSKDGFVWDDGLEDEFVAALKDNIQEYIDIARLTNKERAKEDEFSEEASIKLQENIKSSVENVFLNEIILPQEHDSTELNSTDLQEYVQTILPQSEPAAEIIVGTPRPYVIPINNINKIKLTVTWEIGKKDKWIDVTEKDDETFILININHPFFKPYSNDATFKAVLEKFVIAFVLAQKQAKSISDKTGHVLPETIFSNMNFFLSRMADK